MDQKAKYGLHEKQILRIGRFLNLEKVKCFQHTQKFARDSMRALFVDDWDTDEKQLPFLELEAMNEEVKQLRPLHNFATATAIQEVATTLKRFVDENKLRATLTEISEQALAFWQMS